MKYFIKYSQTGGDMESNNIIDLTNLKPGTNLKKKKDGLKILTSIDERFKPMFENPLNAKKKSPTKSIHLVVPGLMPVLPETWIGYDKKKIFYMPNDFTPHFHGSASHHEGDGFQLDRAFILSKKYFIKTTKELKDFRNELEGFNNGEPETPIETWIHWKIPDNEIQYKDLKIRKNSILWWDFKDWHNLYYCSKESFNNNKVDEEDKENIKIEDNLNKGKNIVVTIMDQIGDYYFICSVPGHAESGHKIKITVV